MYKFKCEIGCGGFSKVKLATHIFMKEQVALKVIKKSKFPGKLEKILAQEVRCMEVLNHPNLIRLYEIIESENKVHLITELAPAGDLYSKIKSNGKMTESEARKIYRQIVDAVLYMHDNGIFHRDIKAENVLFSSPTVCKTCDFGFSTVGKKETLLSTFCGSPAYSAPDIYQNVRYQGGPVDTWALGIVLYFITEGHLPFEGSSMFTLKEAILEGHFEISKNSSKELVHLIKMILKPKPLKRFTVSQIKNHPWLSPPKDEPDTTPANNSTHHAFKNFAIYDIPESLLSNLSYCQEKREENEKEGDASSKDAGSSKVSKEINHFLIPTKEQIRHRSVSKEEMQAYEILLEIGATEHRIRAHKMRGMRSYLIGIYRIILHKIQKGENIVVNKLGLPWDLSGSMTNLNTCVNSEEEGGHLKENKVQEEQECGNELEKREVGMDAGLKLNKLENIEITREITSGSTQKKPQNSEKSQNAKAGDALSTKVCNIL